MIAALVSLPARHLLFLAGKGPIIDTGKLRQQSNILMIFVVHPFLSDKSPEKGTDFFSAALPRMQNASRQFFAAMGGVSE